MQKHCIQCPRACGADRTDGKVGFCGVPWEFFVARAALHHWEEPSISGKNGSGTIFFSGCNLRCAFCKNHAISHGGGGRRVSEDELIGMMLRLRDEGAHNINLVTPTPYAQQLVSVLRRVRSLLSIPVVYNCGGYERVETLRQLDGLIDIYLPDFKYAGGALAKKYSQAEDYPEVALAALREMLRQTGAPQLDADGMLLRGTVVRHLVLPAARKDSIEALRLLADRFGTSAFLLSLMSQYTPEFAMDASHKELHRRVTSFEYESVLSEAERLGFDGYLQARSSATASFTPSFDE